MSFRWMALIAVLVGSVDASDPGLSLTLGTVRLSAQQAGLAYALSYIGDLGDSLQGRFRSYDWGYAKWEPEIDVAMGPAGFGHASLRAAAVACFTPQNEQVVGNDTFVVPDTLGVMHDLLLSGGFETTPELDRLAGVAEFGYVPWLPPDWDWIRFGAFLQAGYQARLAEPDTTGDTVSQGPLARGRTRLSASGRFPARSSRALGLDSEAECWYDFLDTKLRYSVVVALRLFMDFENSIDITYRRNSGAPAFQQGDQFGLGLTVQLGR